jgi:hypothetical protein
MLAWCRYQDYTKFNWASRVQNYISLFFAIDYILRVYRYDTVLVSMGFEHSSYLHL